MTARTPPRRAAGAALLALLAAGAVGAAFGARQPGGGAPRAGEGESALGAGEPDAALAAPPQVAARPEQAPRPAAAPPPISAPAPASCTDNVEDPPGFTRPSVWELVRLRTQELRDRLPQLSRDASPALREGLEGLGAPDPDPALARLREAPDRDRDGFDVAVAGLLNATSRALAERDLEAAAARSQRAAADAPMDPLPAALRALVARERGAPRTAFVRSTRAFALAPDEPAFALLHARAAADLGEHEAALAAVDAYLAEVPDDARLGRWRGRIARRHASTETHARRRWSGVEVLWPDRRAVPVDEVMEAALAGLGATARVLGVARRPELAVVVYPDRAALREATCSPEWTGALFDGALHVDAERLSRPGWERVLRHEATHAQLALTRGRLPFWLNEGVAQWMEGPLTDAKRRRLARLAARGVWIPFPSLEGPFLVIDDSTDAGFAYDQSLAMVLWLVEREGQGAIAEAVAEVERGAPEDLFERLSPGVDGAALLSYLAERAAR